MKLLLHACCGPCLIEPLDEFSAIADELTIVFANSNIHPAEEYERRKATLCAYAESMGATVVELDYDPAAWMEAVGPLARSGAERCRACYRLRLDEAARFAAQGGFDALATTLTISPYQSPEAIREEGRAAAARAGIEWVDRDFRESYGEATRRSRELGMYRQNYCGCVLSDVESREARATRRARKAAEKAARGAGAGEDAAGPSGDLGG
jgi:predicted adenine nucleotide alpha hydrolase (AANH) superfamily ATPase